MDELIGRQVIDMTTNILGRPARAKIVKVVYPELPGQVVLYTLEYPDGKQRERFYCEFILQSEATIMTTYEAVRNMIKFNERAARTFMNAGDFTNMSKANVKAEQLRDLLPTAEETDSVEYRPTQNEIN